MAHSRDRGFRRIAMHVCRIALVLGIVLIIRAEHRERLRQRRQESTAPHIESVREVFPDADSVVADTNDVYAVLSADGNQLGRVVQTSPMCDDICGFSGPTNVLVAFADDRVRALRILSSGDTAEHLQQVIKDPNFLHAFDGSTWTEAAQNTSIDAVSGATLTSLAIVESVARRLGGTPPSLRFPDPVNLDTVRVLFPDADQIAERHVGNMSVFDDNGRPLGAVIHSSPACDNIPGYQGPTETLIGLDESNKVIGIAVGRTFDNEPYIDYVREDKYFRKLFNDKTAAELAGLDLNAAGVEGVSGATMTSMAVTESVLRTAAQYEKTRKAVTAANAADARPWLTAHDWGTVAVILASLVMAFTHLRSHRVAALIFRLILIGYVGLLHGDLLSQAMFVGWAKNGIPWQSATSLCLLTVAAFLVPMTTKKNVYCTHLCPHGALQQLVLPGSSRRKRLPKSLSRVLKLIPALLVILVIVVAVTGSGFSLIDIEPFDAWVFRIAGVATISIAVVGLIASCFYPMAYCRYGCPTGALIEFTRYHARSDRIHIRDGFAVTCLLMAVALSQLN